MRTQSKGRVGLAGILGLMCVYASGALGANLVANPDFNADVSGWTNAGTAVFSWDGGDGSPGFGSANFVGNSSQVGIANSSCIVLAAPQNIDLYANIETPNLEAFNAEALAYTDPGCTNGESTFGAITSTPLPGPGWQQVSATNVSLPGSTQSIRVRLMATPMDLNLNAHVDHVRLGPAGTTPVRLQSFDVK
jgi:hypothetical protein